jgi:chemotaxis protein methyltransferase CheR
LNCIAQDPAYSRLKDHLIASTGLAFYADRDALLTELIGGRLSDLGLRDCAGYARFLANGEKGSAEMEVLIARLTIGETSFFRDEDVFTAIRDVIFPDILERKQASKQLRIWSAGCATGAEPYSLAITLMDQMAGRMAGWQIAIHATDLNRSYLAQAAKGTFRAWALHNTSEEVKRECFSKEGLTWTIHTRYKQWISFQHMNLVDGEFATPAPAGTDFDLILCRNVMIYFTPEMNRRLIGQFYQSLGDAGWLVVGAAEHNLEGYRAFGIVNAPGAKLYQKGLCQAVDPAPVHNRSLTVAARQPILSRERQGAVLPSDNVEGLRQLVDCGNWKDAAAYGQGLLTRDRLNPEIHFYQALIFENLGIVDQVERSLRQAIYLDRNFALAHYHLGLTLKRGGQAGASARSFGNVLKVLAAMPDQAIVTAGPGVTAIGLRELARMHLEDSSGA